MKTNKTTHEMPYLLNTHQLVKKHLSLPDNACLQFCLAVIIGVGFGFETAPVKAENNKELDIQHYMETQSLENTAMKSIQNTKKANPAKNIEVTYQQGPAIKSDTKGNLENTDQATKQTLSEMKCAETEKTSSVDIPQQSQVDRKIEPVIKPADGKGKLPTFAQADNNDDHFVTKLELQNFPYLLQVFDKVDAGNDGRLEQHEYQNLKMETKREGETS